MTGQDPRWNWVEIRQMDGSADWVRGECRHIDTVPVDSGGAVVANLCLTCDQQLP